MEKLIFLGTGCPMYKGNARGESSIYFNKLLLDCGSGTVNKLYKLNLINNIDTVLITHLHKDHINDIFKLISFSNIASQGKKIEIFSPPGLNKILKDYKKSLGLSSKYFFNMDRIKVNEGIIENINIKGKLVTSYKMDHRIINYGYLIESNKIRLFYSGDTRKYKVPKLNVDYLIHEATGLEKHKKILKNVGHSTAKDAALIANEMSATTLFLTHINNWISKDAEILEEAQKYFKGTIHVVKDYDIFKLKLKLRK